MAINETGRSILAQPVYSRRNVGDPLREDHGTKHRPWLTKLLGRRPTKVAAIALANKIARMAWAMVAKDESYRQPVALAR